MAAHITTVAILKLPFMSYCFRRKKYFFITFLLLFQNKEKKKLASLTAPFQTTYLYSIIYLHLK
jgi:hypothetical protein